MGFLVKLCLIGKSSQPLAIIYAFSLREARLDAVELGWVTYVENLCNVELTVQVFHLLLIGVYTELVHQYGKGLATMLLSQLLQVACKIISCYSSTVYVIPFKSFFRRYCYNDWMVARVNALLVNMQVITLSRVLFGKEWALGKVNFIKEELLTSFSPGFFKFSKQLLPLSIKLLLDVWWFDLLLANNFPFNSMLLVKPPQGSDCYSFVDELPMK